MAGPVQPLLDADIRSLGLEESYSIDPAVDNIATLLESLAADLRAGRIWVRGSFGATIKREFKRTKPKPGKEEELTVGLSAAEAQEILTHAYTKITDWRTTGRRGANPYEQKG